MSNPPQVIPIQLDLDYGFEIDDDFEMPTTSSESGLVGTLLGLLKSPLVIGGIAVVVFGIVAALMLTSGSLNPFGAPKLNHNGALAGDSGEVSEELVAQPKLEGEGDDEEDTSEEEEKEEPLPEYGTISYSSSGAVYHNAPTTVTIAIGERSGALTISMGILADPVTADALLQEGLAVNLLKIESAQSLDFGPYLEWQLPGLVTKDFKQRLADKFPDLEVDGIMLRDFRLTQS